MAACFAWRRRDDPSRQGAPVGRPGREPVGKAAARRRHSAILRRRRGGNPYSLRKRIDEFDFGYAPTVHKAQGSQWNDVYLFDESYAFSRAPGALALYRHYIAPQRSFYAGHLSLILVNRLPDNVQDKYFIKL